MTTGPLYQTREPIRAGESENYDPETIIQHERMTSQRGEEYTQFLVRSLIERDERCLSM